MNTRNLGMQFTAMQFGDTPDEKRHDAKILFHDAPFAHQTVIKGGTEAGQTLTRKILRSEATAANHRFASRGDSWLAVDRHLISGNYKARWEQAIDSTQGRGKHTDRGLLEVAFDTADFGRISVGCVHLLTNGRQPGDPNYDLNGRLVDLMNAWGKKAGQGSDLAFIMGDVNTPINKFDAFRGGPWTAIQEELDKIQNTGHGPIDVIASYDKDGRVKAKRVRAWNDKKLFLHTDHFPLFGVFEVETL